MSRHICLIIELDYQMNGFLLGSGTDIRRFRNEEKIAGCVARDLSCCKLLHPRVRELLRQMVVAHFLQSISS